MRHKKIKKVRRDAISVSVKEEMAKPRMARSARIAERNLDIARILEKSSAAMPGTHSSATEAPGKSTDCC